MNQWMLGHPISRETRLLTQMPLGPWPSDQFSKPTTKALERSGRENEDPQNPWGLYDSLTLCTVTRKLFAGRICRLTCQQSEYLGLAM